MTSSTSHAGGARQAGSRSPQIQKAVARLRQMIVTGQLRPGERVAELRLVSAVGVSRTPLRLALERLEHAGLLTRRPGGGFQVRAFTLRDVRHALELRGSLEGMACRFLAELSEPHLDGLFATLDEIDAIVAKPSHQAGATERLAELNEQFHQGIVEAAGNDLLARLVDQVRALPFGPPSALLLVQETSQEAFHRRIVAQAQHRGIVEAIVQRDPSRAEALAREHARMALGNLDALLRNRDTLQQIPGSSLLRFG